jgi:hypothetical protein
VSCSKFNQDCNSGCGLSLSADLPIDSNGIYQLSYNPNLSMTYKQIYAETNCDLHTKISWDSNYLYEIYPGQYTNLINPASMVGEDGSTTIVFGVWTPHINKVITFYGGYTDDCGYHHTDSIRVKVN